MIKELWIARNKDGSLFMYLKKPNRAWNNWYIDNEDLDDRMYLKEDYQFQDLTWNDEPLHFKL